MNRLIETLVKKRNWLAFASLLCVLVSSTQLLHMAFNGDIKVMFDRHDPYLIRLQQLDDTYQQSQYLLMLLEPADKNVFSEAGLNMVRSATAQAEMLPYAIRVDSVTRFPHVMVDHDSLQIDDLVSDGAAITPEMVSRVRALSMADERIRGRLVAENGEVAALLITLALPDSHLQGILKVKKASKQLKKTLLQQFPGAHIYFNGDVAIENAILDVTLDDMLRVNPLVFGVIFLLTGIFLRSVIATAATVAVVATSTAISMGLLVRLGFDINPITMMAPAIIMVLAVADSIHILTQFVLYLQQGETPENAMMRSLKHNAGPVFWTSFTTAVGFLGMNFGDSPPFRDMGNMAAVGVLFAFVCTYTVLPAVTLHFRQDKLPAPLAMTGLMSRLSRWIVRQPVLPLFIILAIVGVLLSQISKLRVNDDLSHYFDDSLDIQHSIQFTRQHIQGVEYILYSLDSGSAGGINDPAFLKKVDAFSAWLRQQPEVVGVDSYVDLVKNLNQMMNDDKPAFHRIPEDRELISQYLLLYEMALPEGMDLTRDVNMDRSSVRMVVNLAASENQALLSIENRADHWLQQNYPELRSLGTSQLLMFAHLGTSIIYSMVDGSLFTLVFITIMMILGLRSVRFGLISMIPNICPPIVVYGVWALTVGEVNHAAAMTFSICLGLVVDDTIHLMSKYLDGRRQGKTAEQSIQAALVSSGTAVVITSVTLVLGISLLSLSHFTVNDTMSLMLASIIFVALLFDLICVPMLLLACDRFSNWFPIPKQQIDQLS